MSAVRDIGIPEEIFKDTQATLADTQPNLIAPAGDGGISPALLDEIVYAAAKATCSFYGVGPSETKD